MSDAAARSQLGEKLAMAAGLIETAVRGWRARPLTVGEYLDGRPAVTLNTSVAQGLLAEADAALAADPAVFFMRADDLVTLAEVAAELRAALALAAPFVKQANLSNNQEITHA